MAGQPQEGAAGSQEVVAVVPEAVALRFDKVSDSAVDASFPRGSNPRRRRLTVAGPSFFDKFPELGVLLQGFILTHGQIRSEQKILQAVPAEDAVHDQPELVPLEVNAILANAKSMERFPVALELAEALQVGAHDFLGQTAELAQDAQLKFLWHPGEFTGAGRVEDNLEWPHAAGFVVDGSAYGNRTRLSALRGPCPNR